MPRARAVQVQIGEAGIGAITTKMILWSTRAGDIRPVGPALAEYLMKTEAKLFDSEGGSAGNPWTALAEATQKTKAREGLRPEIMRATDDLRDALGEPGNENQKVIMSKSVFIFGAKGAPAEYGAIHQASGEPGKPVDLTPINRRVCVMGIKNWITHGSIALEL